MKYRVAIAMLLTSLSAPAPVCADHSLVLIANAESPIDSLLPLELRKVYLGFNVVDGSGQLIRAISNTSNARLWEIFLQDVMGMSARSYDRRLLSLTMQSGRVRPDSFDDLDQILTRIANDRHAIAFVWEEDIKDKSDFKIVRVLWRR